MTNKHLTSWLTILTLIGLAVTVPAIAAPVDANALLKIKSFDKSRFPHMKLHLGLTTTERAVDFKVRENGRLIDDVNVQYKVNKQPVAVTLLVDVSGSMKGKPIEDAKTAAKLFVERSHPQDKIAVVAFSATVNRAADFTNDKHKLNQAIDSLQARGETAVYDGLIESLKAAKNAPLTNQTMILLSDGGDTASKNSGQAAADIAASTKIPVSAITLQSEEFNPTPIEEIARVSGGQVLTAVSSEALKSLYNGLAAELHEGYQLSYKSKTSKAQAKVDVEVNAGGRLLKTSTTISSLPQVVKAVRKAAAPKNINRLNGLASPWLAAALAFLAAAAAVFALANLITSKPNILADQLKYYDQLRGRKHPEPEKPIFEKAHESAVQIVGRVSAKYDFANYARVKLEQAGLPVRPDEYITMHLIGVVAMALAVVFLVGGGALGFVLMSGAVIGPLLALQIKIGQRAARFQDQLPDTLDMLASSMRAGYGLQQAILAATHEAREPTAGELLRVSNQVQMGMTLEEALNKMAERIGDATFRWVVIAISIHRETGGNLAEILDNLATSLRQRETMRRQIRALTAEGRLSAIILIVLPFIESLIMFSLNPSYMSLLVTSFPGVIMLACALGLMLIGTVWLKKITSIEY